MLSLARLHRSVGALTFGRRQTRFSRSIISQQDRQRPQLMPEMCRDFLVMGVRDLAPALCARPGCRGSIPSKATRTKIGIQSGTVRRNTDSSNTVLFVKWRCLHRTNKAAAPLAQSFCPVSSVPITTFDDGHRPRTTGARRSSFLADRIRRCSEPCGAELEHQTNEDCLCFGRRSFDSD